MRTNDIVLVVLLIYGVAIAARLGLSAARGEGHEWQLWDGGLLLRGKRMGPRATVVAFVVAVVIDLAAAAALARSLA